VAEPTQEGLQEDPSRCTNFKVFVEVPGVEAEEGADGGKRGNHFGKQFFRERPHESVQERNPHEQTAIEDDRADRLKEPQHEFQ